MADDSQEVADIIDALEDPTPLAVYEATSEYDGDYVAAAAASIAANASGGGGSMPGSVRLLDLGTVTAADVADGPVLLYTPSAGEEILGIVTTAGVDVDEVSIGIGYLDPPSATSTNPKKVTTLAAMGQSAPDLYDSARFNAENSRQALVRSQAIYAAPLWDLTAANISRNWAPNTLYPVTDDDTLTIVAAGHIWGNTAGAAGTSGGSEPDFAGNIGGSVADGPNLIWTDLNQIVSTVGSITARALVATPASP